MKLTRVKVILLVWVLLFQPMLSLASNAEAEHDHSQHDHSQHDHSAEHQHVAQNDHHASDAHHDHPESVKPMATHDCGPCVNGDMSHCQCGAVLPSIISTIYLDSSSRDTQSLYQNILAAHNQSLIRPPILA